MIDDSTAPALPQLSKLPLPDEMMAVVKAVHDDVLFATRRARAAESLEKLHQLEAHPVLQIFRSLLADNYLMDVQALPDLTSVADNWRSRTLTGTLVFSNSGFQSRRNLVPSDGTYGHPREATQHDAQVLDVSLIAEHMIAWMRRLVEESGSNP